MPSEKEMKAQKEDKLFDIHYARVLLESGKALEARRYLSVAEERSISGMDADEIDAVRERVKRAVIESERE